MKPIGFVICNKDQKRLYTKGKIYPYYNIVGPEYGDFKVKITNDNGLLHHRWMYLDDKIQNDHIFDFYYPPEFPKDTNQWTEDDWFQYDLKYGR